MAYEEKESETFPRSNPRPLRIKKQKLYNLWVGQKIIEPDKGQLTTM